MYKRWVIVFCSMILLASVFAGCQQDEKRAESIYESLEKSARMEKDAIDKQQDLHEAGLDEEAIYDKIIALDIDHKDQIKKQIEKARKENTKRNQLLQEIKFSYDKGFELSLAIKSKVDKIKDTKQKKQANVVVQLMDKRKEQFQSYYKQYNGLLKHNADLYEQLQTKEIKATDLDKQIIEINRDYKEMEKQGKQFNSYTKQYNKAKAVYYQKSNLNERHIKRMKTT